MVLTKYLFSACLNAAILMNTGGVAPGWLFGRGDFGYNRGKTLYEIMEVKTTKTDLILYRKTKIICRLLKDRIMNHLPQRNCKRP